MIAKHKKTIMVIEDEDLLLNAISQKLTLSGFGVIPCSNGEQALEHLKDAQSIPDVIWLDYFLNGMNGLEVVTELKKNNAWKDIPIFIVSNSSTPKQNHAMLALGIKKYILKAEYRLDQIIKMIDEFDEEDGKGN